MERIDRLARTLAATPAARRRLGLLLAGLVLGWRQGPVAAQDETGVAIADASGGDATVAGVAEPAPGPRRSHDPSRPDDPDDPDDDDEETCRPATREERCGDRCGREVGDGCGGQITCACPEGERCGPGDRCCPEPRLCLASDVCCPASEVCARGGGVCCAPELVCTVGGVAEACCSAPGSCIDGVCVPAGVD